MITYHIGTSTQAMFCFCIFLVILWTARKSLYFRLPIFQASVVNPTNTFLSAALNKLSSSRQDCWSDRDFCLLWADFTCDVKLNPLRLQIALKIKSFGKRWAKDDIDFSRDALSWIGNQDRALLMSYLVVQRSMSKICYRLLLLKTPLSGREFQMFYSSEVLFMQKGRNFF